MIYINHRLFKCYLVMSQDYLLQKTFGNITILILMFIFYCEVFWIKKIGINVTFLHVSQTNSSQLFN